MTYRGHIKNGVAVLDTPAGLPDGIRVRVEVESPASEFWAGKTIEDLAGEQHVEPAGRIDDLVIDWPEEDSVDEFLAMVQEARR
jgi:hypothetical protein